MPEPARITAASGSDSATGHYRFYGINPSFI